MKIIKQIYNYYFSDDKVSTYLISTWFWYISGIGFIFLMLPTWVHNPETGTLFYTWTGICTFYAVSNILNNWSGITYE